MQPETTHRNTGGRSRRCPRCSRRATLTYFLIIGLASLATLRADTQPTLDDLLNITTKSQPTPTKQPVSNDLAPMLPDVAQTLSVSDTVDIFERALHEMSQVARRLGGELDPGLETQRIHGSILAKLDQVIDAAANSEPRSSASGSSGKMGRQDTGSSDNALSPSQAGTGLTGSDASARKADSDESSSDNDSTDVAGPLREARVEWGSLPDRLREELLQGINERFSPIYKKATEAYYRRLAEEGR